MDNLPLQLINSIQKILIDIGDVKTDIGKARVEIQSVGASNHSINNKLSQLEGDLQEHEKKVDAHYSGEIKHDKEQSFLVNTQLSTLFLSAINVLILGIQIFRSM